jgi:hypothetical protein
MQSLYIFIKEKNLNWGFRVSLENFSEINQVGIFPLYAVYNLMHHFSHPDSR